MKIIITTPLYPPETAEPAPYVKELAEQLKTKHKITIITYANHGEEISGTKLIAIKKRLTLPWRLWRYFWVLFKETGQVNIIYTQTGAAVSLPAIIVGRLRRVPVVFRFMEDEAWERATRLRLTTRNLENFLASPQGNFKIRLIKMLNGFVLKQARTIIAPSAYLKKIINHYYHVPENKIIVNYNPLLKSEILPFPPAPIAHQLFINAGFTKKNGVEKLIKAINHLQSEFHDIRLLIAGAGEEEKKLKVLVKKLGIDNKIIFLGRVSSAENWDISRNSQIYIITPTNEYLPYAPQNCFKTDTRVINLNAEAAKEIIQDGQNGLLMTADNEEKIVLAIARLFKDSTLRERLAHNAREQKKEKFSWEAHLRVLNNVLLQNQKS